MSPCPAAAAALEAQLVARAEWFRSVARLEVDTDGLAPGAIVDAIVERAGLTRLAPTP